MADVLHKTNVPADYRRSVNTPDFPAADWFHAPDVSAVVAVPAKYWRVGTNPVEEMSQAEKDAVDAAEASAATDGAKTAADALIDGLDGYSLRALAKILLDELNALRQQIVGVVTFSWDPANMNNGTGITRADIAVTGAAFGDSVDVIAPYTLGGVIAFGYVHAADTVGVRLQNATGSGVNLANGTWKVVVRRHAAMPPRTLAQAKTAYKNALSSGEAD